MTPDPIRLRAGDACVVVDPEHGGRVVSWTVGGLELLGRRGEHAVEYGMFPMAPWPGRLRGNRVRLDDGDHELAVTYDGWAMHGTVFDAPFEAVPSARPDSRIELVAPLGDGWPRPGRVRQLWELRPEALVSSLAVEADGPPFVAEVGWHPWFRRRLTPDGAPVAVELPATGMLERGPDHLPTGTVLDPAGRPGPFDDAFVVPSGRAALTWPGVLRLDVVADVGWYVLFDELDDHVCLEPQSGPPDGLGPSAHVVSRDSPLSATATWSWSRV